MSQKCFGWLIAVTILFVIASTNLADEPTESELKERFGERQFSPGCGREATDTAADAGHC